jgi:phosphate transport system permease protein
MNIFKQPAQILAYVKSRRKENLLPGSLLFASGAIAASVGLGNLFNAFLTDSYSLRAIDVLIGDVAVSLIMILPSLVLFIAAYFLMEAHSMGWKLSIGTCLAVALLGTANIVSPSLAVAIGTLTAVATLLEVRYRRATKSLLRDSPTSTENAAKLMLSLSGYICIITLIGLVVYIGLRAAPYLSWNFISSTIWDDNVAKSVFLMGASKPIGILSYIIGSFLLVGTCELIAIPIGLGAAIYLAEYAPQNKLTDIVRFFIETLAGVPSIVIGLVGAALFVQQLRWGYSLLGGAFSLAFMILPWNIRVAEEAMKSVPSSYREAAFALGATKWQTVRKAVLFSASPGIITGILLGVGGALGEATVLWFTSTAGSVFDLQPLNFQLFGKSVTALPVLIFEIPRTMWPGENAFYVQYSVALAASFVLIILFLVICVAALIVRNYLTKKITGK